MLVALTTHSDAYATDVYLTPVFTLVRFHLLLKAHVNASG